MNALSYIFWPRPPALGYHDTKIQGVLLLCLLLVALSFGLKYWRRKQQNPITKKLSRSWSSAALWFGLTGLVFAIARAEDISYVSMRFWWVVWVAALVLFVVLQLKLFKARHYEKLPTERVEDPRDKYLPGKK